MKGWATTFILAVLVLLQCPSGAAEWLANDQTLLKQGRFLYQSGQFDQALKPISQVISNNPNLAEAYYWRALCRNSLKETDEALGDLNNAIKLDGNVPTFYVSRGLIFSNQGKYDLAMSDFDAALQIDPSCSEARINKEFCKTEMAGQSALAQKRATDDSGTDEQQERLRTERQLADARKHEQSKNKITVAPAGIEPSRPADKNVNASAGSSDLTSNQTIPALRSGSMRQLTSNGASLEKVAEADDINDVDRPVKDKWALIVGISNFQNPDLNLHYPSKDARDFYDFLTTKGNFSKDHVKLLVDKDATRSNILSLLGDKWLPRVANPDDLVVIYISSHGSSSDLDVGGVNYLLAYDSDVENLYASGLPMQDLTRIIKGRVHSDRVVMILDACHSGAASAESKGLSRGANVNAEEIAQGTGQLVISSSAPNQVSWESKKDQNSVFTKYLIEGLTHNGKDTSLGAAFQYMKDRVQEEVLRERGVLQTPVLRTKWKGKDLVIAAPPVNPRPGLSVNIGTNGEADSKALNAR